MTSSRKKGHSPPIVVVIYCYEYGNQWFQNWGPSSVGKGLGGSEESVVFISRELAHLGYWVEVYADPSPGDTGLDLGWTYNRAGGADSRGGVVWYPYTAYDISQPADIFVAWSRYHISLALGQRSRRRFLWLQDNPGYSFPPILRTKLDGIFCLSKFHAGMLSEPMQPMARVIPNGIDPQYLTDGENRPDVFVYGSSPSRGLHTVLLTWPQIRAGVPTATLEVYYGFSDSFMVWGKANILHFDEWIIEMNTLLGQEGVIYKGMVDHHTLAEAYARAGFILYPTTFPETGCVTLMKAQAMGAIPITSRFPPSSLPELTNQWDMGPERGLPIDAKSPFDYPEWMKRWVDAVILASRTDSQER
ncbi:unnamed protein product, partial [Choristocarpus tenellus]